MGLCFGVRDAIELARDRARQGPISLLGELVHNPAVMDDLSSRGVRIECVPEPDRTSPLMITAHGISERRRSALKALGRELIDGTCPLVRSAHQALKGLCAHGYFPVIVGLRDHVEVRGLTEDLTDYAVIRSRAEVEALPERTRYGIVAQTTQPIDLVHTLVDQCHRCFPTSEVRFVDTVCRPTKQHQTAAVELAQRSDVVLVIGGRHSNNTRELASTCARHCKKVHHIVDHDELREEWLQEAQTVGLTAGTSTPDSVIDAVEQKLEKWFNADATTSSAR